MKSYYKQCEDSTQVSNFLKRIGLPGFIDPGSDIPEEYDFDGWIDAKETRGASIQVTPGFEVFVTKYTRKDLKEVLR